MLYSIHGFVYWVGMMYVTISEFLDINMLNSARRMHKILHGCRITQVRR